jgi:molybdate transport system regulatory protein
VILSEDTAGRFKVSARNQFCGHISAIEKGAVNSDVTVELGDGQRVSAIVTNTSLEEMGLEVGARCCALVKSSHVLLAVAD